MYRFLSFARSVQSFSRRALSHKHKMTSTQDEEVVYTDGSCFNNGDRSRACAGYSVFFGEGDARNLSMPVSGDKHTNQVGELAAVYEALRRADPSRRLLIVSDSKYVINGLVGENGQEPWHKRWLRNNWRTAAKKPVANRELWEALIAISKKRTFRMKWQRGHAGSRGNERADAMAKAGARFARILSKARASYAKSAESEEPS